MVVYADPTPRWVPFALAGLITVGGWWGGYWSPTPPNAAVANVVAPILLALMLVAIALQGRAFWTTSIDSITIAAGSAELVTMRWLGAGRRVTFGPADTSEWRAKPKHDDPRKLSTVSFKAKGEVWELSFLSPKVVDVDALALLSPAFFAKLRADYPGLVSKR